ncbi:TPM domain-containing protein [Leptospira sp. GIMC2001]|uniref:TPM domain-containing protein n=1 Tax=Leptospira sp. GIMC2001 TaxID=1513297 RepID=UPI00234B9CF2|nr:TPM domain-containing protein [Leptospira sp. GIMC2001]WCL48278.1 TPM domain-containing protein [Leptospira sp. GIMC2001]
MVAMKCNPFPSRILFGIFFFFVLFNPSNTNLLKNSVEARDIPPYTHHVVDEVGLLSETTLVELEEKLKNHEYETSNQIAILIIKHLEDENLEEYSLKVAESWALGQKSLDNGVLVLIAIDDRKIRIEVGYGLEGSLTDILAKQIIRNEITPHFKTKEYDLGVTRGVDAIISAIKNEYISDNKTETQSDDYGNDSEDKTFLEEYKTFVEEAAVDDIPLFFRIFIGTLFLIVITPFTFIAATVPYLGWFLYFFLIPFYGTFPLVILGKPGALLLPTYLIVVFCIKMYLLLTPSGRAWRKEKVGDFTSGSRSGSSSRSGGSSSRSSSGGFSSSRSSGGGGSFGGGGSSGSW